MPKVMLYGNPERLNNVAACLNSIELETGRLREQLRLIKSEMNPSYRTSETATMSMTNTPEPAKEPEKPVKICSNKQCHKRYTTDGYRQFTPKYNQPDGFISRDGVMTFCSMTCLERWSNLYSRLQNGLIEKTYQQGKIIA